MNKKMNIAKRGYLGSLLRFVLISEQWKDELYACYTDRYLQKYIDDHNCETIFQFKNKDEMARCIGEWKQACEENHYFRWVAETKNDHKIIGTIEIASIPDTTNYISRVFNKKPGTFVDNPTHLFEQGVQNGVLRIDIISSYAQGQIFDDILKVTQNFFNDYGLQQIIVQCLAKDKERRRALERHGFETLKIEGEILYPYLIRRRSAADKGFKI